MSEARPDLDIIIVHFRARTLLERCMRDLLADLQGSGLRGRIMVVDNEASRKTEELVSAKGGEYMDPGSNLGYGPAINYGMARSQAKVAVFMNPDVFVLSGCLVRLLKDLRVLDITGPHFYLDLERKIFHPPGTRRTAMDDVLQNLSTKSRLVAGFSRRLFRLRARSEWLHRRRFSTSFLCGAMLACRRTAFQRIQGFDERFRLYYEENDWLRRAVQSGLVVGKSTRAGAIHLHNQCCQHQPRASEWFLESQDLYQKLHYPSWFFRASEVIAGLSPIDSSRWSTQEKPEPALEGYRLPLWLELSPLPEGFPFCCTRIENSEWRLASEFWNRLAAGNYYFRLVSDCGRELNSYRVLKS
jgi:GT2 family glycosyltransferase